MDTIPRRLCPSAGRSAALGGDVVRLVCIVIAATVLAASAAWAGPAECPGAADPRLFDDASCPGSDCTSSAGTALEDIALALCALNPTGGACNRCQCCKSARADLFAGTTLRFGGGDPLNYCFIGGRGRQMGEAALCLLRDLANKARPPSDASGPPGIVHERPAASLGIGDVKVKQHVGFVDFDIPARRMRGFHAVSLCAPVLGCVSNMTQPFTATLVDISGETRGDWVCGNYQIVDPSWVLRIDTERVEHSMFVSLGPYYVPTPIGPVTIRPEFSYEMNLEPVTTPWAGENLQIQGMFPCGGSRMGDVTDALGGAFASYVGAFGFIADGWDAYLGLGGRDADPKGNVWAPPGGVAFPLRPDFDFRIARKNQEHRPSGRIRTGVRVPYGIEMLRAKLNTYPFSVNEAYLEVATHLDASVVSQFGIGIDEGDVTVPAGGDCQNRGQTRVRMQSALDAQATIDGEAKVVLDFTLHLLLTSKRFRFDPSVELFDAKVVPEDLWVGPEATAMMPLKSPPPPYPAQYNEFKSFSGGDVDGRAFVDACLLEDPPTPQTPPEPSVEPGDPLDLLKGLEQQCNICLYFPSTVTEVCVPKQSLVDAGTIPADYDKCDPAINGMRCLDPNCENVPVSPPQAVNLKEVVFPASQQGLPADKQWTCNAFEKFGCFDLCRYDPTKPDSLTVTQSAVDTIGTRCRDATGGSDPSKNGARCNSSADCDDGNPCTEDRCGGTGEFHICIITQSTGPCDDGLYCTGEDSCALGICGVHAENPCSATTGCCNEATDSCPASCDPDPCAGKAVGDSCDDGTICTNNDRCQETPAGLRCAGTAVLSCASTTCTAGVCQEVAGEAQCATVPNGVCPITCGNGVLDAGEECDVPSDTACPGKCGPDCYCGLGDDDGSPCTDANQCASGYCVTGLCCDRACESPLLRCDLPGHRGTCTPAPSSVPLLSPAMLPAVVGILAAVAALGLRRRR